MDQERIQQAVYIQGGAEDAARIAQHFGHPALFALGFKQAGVFDRVDALVRQRLEEHFFFVGKMVGAAVPDDDPAHHGFTSQHRHSQHGTQVFNLGQLLHPVTGHLEDVVVLHRAAGFSSHAHR